MCVWGIQQSFMRIGSGQRFNPLPFYIPFLTEKGPAFVLIPSIDKRCLFDNLVYNFASLVTVNALSKSQNQNVFSTFS